MTRAVFVLLVGLSFSSLAAEVRYSFTEVGILPGFLRSKAEAINERGEVVGYCVPPGSSNITSQAFYWTNGNMIAVGYAGKSSFATDINAGGEAVIATEPNAIYHEGSLQFITRLPTGQSFGAVSINAAGWLAGSAYVDQRSKAYAWISNSYINISPGLHDVSGARAINNAGQVTGVGYNPDPHPFLYTPGSGTRYLPTLSPDTQGSGSDINDAGDVIGHGMGFLAANERSFLYRNTGELIELMPLPAGGETFALGINNRGQIVGRSTTRAVIWGYDGVAVDLTSLLDSPGEGWVLGEATDINDAGQIVGMASFDPDGPFGADPKVSAFLITPRPMLEATMAGDTITFSWSANFSGFRLYQKGAVDSSSWTEITNSVSSVDGKVQVVLPAPKDGNQFFRLEKL